MTNGPPTDMTDARLLSGKVALVTGATSGIGLATARAFLDAGATVYATGADHVEEAAGKLTGATVLASDAGSVEAIGALAERIGREQGTLDILMLNAGFVIHHAGTSSGVVDGSAALLLASQAGLEANGWRPRARVVTAVNQGDCPTLILNAPVPAARTVGILAGAGGSFCAGMDLKAFLRGEKPSIPGRGFAGLTMAPPEKPLIAAVDGYALAGGMEIALACDLIVANREARFGIPEVKRGLAARAGGLLRLPRQLPYRIAMEMALTGGFISAQRASELGLVNRLCDGPALDTAKALAEEIGMNGPLAVAASKKVIARSRFWTDEEMWDRQAEIVDPVFASEDAREGAAAFAEKRSPVWVGR